MIISASRRTDLPAFYSEWFMNRIRAGFCDVPNPFNPSQVSRVSLGPKDVDAIVFWTRNPHPLLPCLKELDAEGYRYCFLYTLLDYPKLLEPRMPPVESRVETFRRLAEAIGSERVIWRYDPIVIGSLTPVDFHKRAFARIAAHLEGYTTHCIVSFVDLYRKLTKRLRWLEEQGCTIREPTDAEIADLAAFIAGCASTHGMRVTSCAEEHDLAPWGIPPGRCIDGDYLSSTLGVLADTSKDPSQRPACGCAPSKDIGCYDTCLHACRYCYATSNDARARERYAKHDPNHTSLVKSG